VPKLYFGTHFREALLR